MLVWRLIILENEIHCLDNLFDQFLQLKMDALKVNSEKYLIEFANAFLISYIYKSFLIEFVNWIVFWKFENSIFKSIPLEPHV